MKQKKLTGRMIDAMTPREKKALADKLERQTPQQRWADARPLTGEERERLARIGKKMGRPKIGRGTRAVTVTVEIDLLERADAYARKAGLKRAELFTQGLRCVVPPE